jgi:hypothetical protein
MVHLSTLAQASISVLGLIESLKLALPCEGAAFSHGFVCHPGFTGWQELPRYVCLRGKRK